MKYPIILLVAIFLYLPSYAQKIHFTDLSNAWIYQYRSYEYNRTQGHHQVTRRVAFAFLPPKIIDGKTFYKLNDHYVYEDTVKKIVYIDDTSHILYNYNWQVGDTFLMPYGRKGINTIIKIDTTVIEGNPYKVFTVNVDSGFSLNRYMIVEGIGSIPEPLFPWVDATLMNHADRQLLCYQNAYSRPVIDVQYGINTINNNCNTPYLEVNKLSHADKVVIYPQPANGTVSISLPQDVQSGTIRLLDMSGKVVYSKAFANEPEIVVDKQNMNGIYFYKISGNDGVNYNGKIIFN